MFSDPEFRDQIENIQRENSFIKNVIEFGAEFDRLMQQLVEKSSADFICEKQRTDDRIAFILCSSGTTGLPKGVQLSQKNVMVSVNQYAYAFCNILSQIKIKNFLCLIQETTHQPRKTFRSSSNHSKRTSLVPCFWMHDDYFNLNQLSKSGCIAKVLTGFVLVHN